MSYHQPPSATSPGKITEPFLESDRLLSIQSHVVSGYVGNRAATFPLQLLGYDVDVVNTVQHSNHAGYGHTDGSKATPEQLAAVFEALERNGLGRWARVLTGYHPGASTLTVVRDEICKLKNRARARSPPEDVIYLLDPVMGDIGKGLYVAEDSVQVYRQLLNQATIVTPNQFETELLAQCKITSIHSLHEALNVLHSAPYSVPCVAISSILLPRSVVHSMKLPAPPPEYTALLPDGGMVKHLKISAHTAVASSHGRKERLASKTTAACDQVEDPMVLVCFASARMLDSESPQTYAFALPTVDGYISGVGDLFASLVLAFYKPEGSPLRTTANAPMRCSAPEKGRVSGIRPINLPPFAAAVSKALLGVQQVLLRTHLHTLQLAREAKKRRERSKNSGSTSLAEEDCIPSDPELDSLPPRPVSKGELPRPARIARRMRLRELRIIQEKDKLMKLAVDDKAGWPGCQLDWPNLLYGDRAPI